MDSARHLANRIAPVAEGHPAASAATPSERSRHRLDRFAGRIAAATIGALLAGSATVSVASARAARPADSRQVQPGSMKNPGEVDDRALARMAARRFAAMDTNHDGKVDRREFEGYWNRHFPQADTNHDGQLSLEEAEAAAHRLQGSGFSHVWFDRTWNAMTQTGKANQTIPNGRAEGGITSGQQAPGRSGHVARNQYIAWHDALYSQAAGNQASITEPELRRALEQRNRALAAR